ncbi:MAG: hypothetical protein M1815_006010 [Lichina confinis]|nr:MAG: hypothetical protein M1815_006010 [Lichina confinis]
MKLSNALSFGIVACVAFWGDVVISTALPEPQFNIPGTPSRNIICGTSRSLFSFSQQQAALDKGNTLHIANQTRGRNRYPHRFGNAEGIRLSGACFAGQSLGQLQEYPIMRTGAVYDGSSTDRNSGPHRVIFHPIPLTGRSIFCGLITHEGSWVPGGFVGCSPTF